MASASETITEADILTQVVAPDQPTMSPQAARSILDLGFSADAVKRMGELADKNNKGTINQTETAELDKYRRVGLFLDLMQAKARHSLGQAESPA